MKTTTKDTKKSVFGPDSEPGEERLAFLIREAGRAVREKKKKMLEAHFNKIHLAVTGQLGKQGQEKPI